jgi:hypothetical protein
VGNIERSTRCNVPGGRSVGSENGLIEKEYLFILGIFGSVGPVSRKVESEMFFRVV